MTVINPDTKGPIVLDGPPTLPSWVPPLDTGQPAAEDLNNLGSLPKANFAARNSVIPIIYGRDRLFGKMFAVHVDEDAGFLYIGYTFGEGEIGGYETLLVDSVDVNDAQTGFLLSAGAVVELHVGTAGQSTSTLLSGAIVGYTDTLPNTAYVVLKVPQGSTRGFPRCEAIIQGRKVYDPRLDTTRSDITPVGSGSHRENDNTTWEFSENPTICFRDMVINFTNWPLFDQGVVDNANINDELIDGVARRKIGLTLGKPNSVDSWAKGFRTYMGGFLGWEGGKVRIVPNRPDVEAPGAVVVDASAGTWVDMGDQAVLDMDATQDFTVEVSFKMGSTTGVTQVLVGKKNNAGAGTAGYVLYINSSDNFVCRIDDGTNVVSDTGSTEDFFDNEWHTLVMAIDQTANEMTVTVDGTARTPVSIASVTATLANTVPFRIGAAGGGAGGERAEATIDEVRVWDDVRTPAELTDNRLNEIVDPTLDASLVGYWKLNELATSVTAVDSSASGNDGTLAGAADFTFGNAQIIPDGVAVHIGVDDIVKDSLRLKRRSLRSVPNSVAIDYEDSSGARWFTSRVQADSARVTLGAEARRLSRVSLPGIHNASQAQREATERLNWYLTDLDCTLTLFDEGWQLQHGSIVAVTHPIGLDAKLFRVRQSTAKSGRWVVDLTEYDPAIYSDSVIADPTVPDTNLGDPLHPPTVSNLVLAEELFNYKNGNTGSRVRITWDATGFPFLSQYLVEGYVAGAKVWQTFTGATNIATPGVEELVSDVEVDYEVRVFVQSPFASGAAVIDNVAIQGKLAAPSDVPSVTATQSAAGRVELVWDEATDIDIWRYEVRRGTTSDTWATATALGLAKSVLIDGLNYQETGLALGTHRYFVKAIDSVDKESVNETFSDVILVAPTAVAALNGFEVASEVRLNWPAQTLGFVERYRIAYSDIPETFETTLDVVDTLRFQTKDVPEGTFTFKVFALDAQGNESATAATIDIEVTSDADAFLADSYNFSFRPDTEPDIVANGSLTNFVEWDIRLDDKKYYVTNMADAFAVSPTDFVAADPLANYHSTGASEWLSETKDFGLLLTGSWNLTHDIVSLNGVFDVLLELSTDDVTYVSFGGSSKGEFRYARVRISTVASPGTATAFVMSPLMSLNINVVPLEESGESVSSPNAGVGDTVNLSREYTALKEITTQPKNTISSGSAVTSIVDNIVVGPNTAIQCNGTEYYSGGDYAELDFGTGDFSIECITKHTGSVGNNKILCAKRNGSLEGWILRNDYGTNEIEFIISDGTTTIQCITTGDALPNDGKPHHVIVTVDRTGDLVRIYVDSVEAGGSPFNIVTVTGSVSSAANFNIFAVSDGSNIHESGGQIDQLRIWSDVRTPAEIDATWNKALDMTVTQAGLVHYQLCDGDVGGVTGNITDVTVNARTLTATGAGDNSYVDPGNGGPNVQKINSFDVFIFDTFGQQLAEQFQWKWRAV